MKIRPVVVGSSLIEPRRESASVLWHRGLIFGWPSIRVCICLCVRSVRKTSPASERRGRTFCVHSVCTVLWKKAETCSVFSELPPFLLSGRESSAAKISGWLVVGESSLKIAFAFLGAILSWGELGKGQGEVWMTSRLEPGAAGFRDFTRCVRAFWSETCQEFAF